MPQTIQSQLSACRVADLWSGVFWKTDRITGELHPRIGALPFVFARRFIGILFGVLLLCAAPLAVAVLGMLVVGALFFTYWGIPATIIAILGFGLYAAETKRDR